MGQAGAGHPGNNWKRQKMDMFDRAFQQARGILESSSDNHTKLFNLLQVSSYFWSVALSEHAVAQRGDAVSSGPFEGLKFPVSEVEGCLLPRILGCYEAELHEKLEDILKTKYDCIINIGCGEGYYAVGLARRLPEATVYAHDINIKAQEKCANLSELNGVRERVIVGGEFSGENFRKFSGKRTLVLCDIEGGELNLLRPDLYPELKQFDIVVELHDFIKAGTSHEVIERFRETHDIELVENNLFRKPLVPDWMKSMHDLTLLLAVCEFRPGPTPWAIMRAR